MYTPIGCGYSCITCCTKILNRIFTQESSHQGYIMLQFNMAWRCRPFIKAPGCTLLGASSLPDPPSTVQHSACIVGSPQLILDGHDAHTVLCRLWPRWMWPPPSTACSSTSQHTSQWSSSLLAWKASVRSQSCLCAMQSTRICTGVPSCCCISETGSHIVMYTSADCTDPRMETAANAMGPGVVHSSSSCS